MKGREGANGHTCNSTKMADKWSSLSQRNSETLCKISQKYIPEKDRELGYLYSILESEMATYSSILAMENSMNLGA